MGNKHIMDNKSLAALDYYYEKQEPIFRECLLALKNIILLADENIKHTRKFQIPFFIYKEFDLVFLWVHKKKIIIGFVEDKKMVLSASIKRKINIITKFEIYPNIDIPIIDLKNTLAARIEIYNNAKLKV